MSISTFDFSKFKLPLTEENRKELRGLVRSSTIKWTEIPLDLRQDIMCNPDPALEARMKAYRDDPNSGYGKYD